MFSHTARAITGPHTSADPSIPPRIPPQASPACPGATFLNAPSVGMEYGKRAEATAPVHSIEPSRARATPTAAGKPCQSSSRAAVTTVTSTVYGRVTRASANARARSSTYASRVPEMVCATIQNAEVSCPNWLYICTPSMPAPKLPR